MTARAVLHHVADARAAIANLVASVRPGGAILLIEPDFLPVSVAEPPDVRAFWDGWLAWSRRAGIDYLIGRSLPAALAGRACGTSLRPPRPRSTTAARRGPTYWIQTVVELRGRLVASGDLDDRSIDAFLAHCADPAWWTQTIAFTAVAARAPGG